MRLVTPDDSFWDVLYRNRHSDGQFGRLARQSGNVICPNRISSVLSFPYWWWTKNNVVVRNGDHEKWETVENPIEKSSSGALHRRGEAYSNGLQFYDHSGFLFRTNFPNPNQTFHIFRHGSSLSRIRIFQHDERKGHKFISIARNLFRPKWKSESKWPNKPNDTNIFPVK